MRKASNILFTIGKVVNVLALISTIFLMILGIVAISNAQILFEELVKNPENTIESVDAVKALGIGILVVSIIVFALQVASVIIATKCKRQNDENAKSDTPSVVLIILGLLGENIFYLLSGVLYLIDKNKSQKTEKVVEVDE